MRMIDNPKKKFSSDFFPKSDTIWKIQRLLSFASTVEWGPKQLGVLICLYPSLRYFQRQPIGNV